MKNVIFLNMFDWKLSHEDYDQYRDKIIAVNNSYDSLFLKPVKILDKKHADLWSILYERIKINYKDVDAMVIYVNLEQCKIIGDVYESREYDIPDLFHTISSKLRFFGIEVEYLIPVMYDETLTWKSY